MTTVITSEVYSQLLPRDAFMSHTNENLEASHQNQILWGCGERSGLSFCPTYRLQSFHGGHRFDSHSWLWRCPTQVHFWYKSSVVQSHQKQKKVVGIKSKYLSCCRKLTAICNQCVVSIFVPSIVVYFITKCSNFLEQNLNAQNVQKAANIHEW